MLVSSSVVKSISSSSTGVMQQLPGPVDPDALLTCLLLLLFHVLLEFTIFGICNIITHLLQHNSYFHGIRSTSLTLEETDTNYNVYLSLTRDHFFFLNGVIFKNIIYNLFLCLTTKKVYNIFFKRFDSHNKI